MLAAIVIRKNIVLSLSDLSQALKRVFSSGVLVSVSEAGLSLRRAISSSSTPKVNSTCSFHSEKLVPLSLVTEVACEVKLVDAITAIEI